VAVLFVRHRGWTLDGYSKDELTAAISHPD
jgi:hypothetical protein